MIHRGSCDMEFLLVSLRKANGHKKKETPFEVSFLVGPEGFEPPTLWV